VRSAALPVARASRGRIVSFRMRWYSRGTPGRKKNVQRSMRRANEGALPSGLPSISAPSGR